MNFSQNENEIPIQIFSTPWRRSRASTWTVINSRDIKFSFNSLLKEVLSYDYLHIIPIRQGNKSDGSERRDIVNEQCFH